MLSHVAKQQRRPSSLSLGYVSIPGAKVVKKIVFTAIMRTNGFYRSETLSASVNGRPIVTYGHISVAVVPHNVHTNLQALFILPS